jgi:hypothetical protein
MRFLGRLLPGRRASLAQGGRDLAMTGRQYNRWCIAFMDQVIADLQPRVSAQGLSSVAPAGNEEDDLLLIGDWGDDGADFPE